MRPPRRLFAAAVALAASLAVSPAHAVLVERIVAVVGDRPVLLSELRGRAKPFLLQIQQKVPPGAQQAAAESQLFKELIQKVVDDELISQAAEKAKISVASDELQNAMRNLAQNEGVQISELYRLARVRSGLTEQEYRDEIRRQVLEGKMLQLRVKGRVRVTEDDVRAMYDRTLKDELRRREYHPAWIVLRLMPGASKEAIEERRRLAATLAERARRGEDFAQLARQYSDDTATREAGGDLGVRAPQGTQAAMTGRREVMSPELEAAIFQLKPGEVAAPLPAADALVILKLVSRQPSRYTTFDAARGEMIQRVQNEIFEKAKRKWLEELKRRTHLEVRL
jgi:peptidyl-prolyl cis-trans isomerase SurA